MNCTVCGVLVEEIARRPTVPTDFEFRFQAVKVWYVDPDGEDHRCRLKPRIHIVAEPQYEEQPYQEPNIPRQSPPRDPTRLLYEGEL